MQPEVNIGLVGHVDHGKTTLTEALTGRWTDTHSEEIKRGITIRLGYADTVLRKCPKCGEPECYTVKEKCLHCKEPTVPVRKVSFVDAPGHESLMATMIAGATVMDGALLLIAANEPCPQPQTREHLMALQIVGIKDVVIVQNKIDLVSKEESLANYKQIKEFVKGTPYEDAPIIPISAQQRINIGALIQAMQEKFPTPERDESKDPIFYVVRSFDINRPGAEPLKISGGVLGGVLRQGLLKKGIDIEIAPGRKVEKQGRTFWQPVSTKILSLKTGGNDVSEIHPSGSIGLMTTLDPSVVKSDTLAGSIAGLPGKLPPVWSTLKLQTNLLERVVGAKDVLVVEPIKLKEQLMLNVNSAATVGVVSELKKDHIICELKLPVCAETGSRVTISRIVGTRWRLIGYGIIK
ncbi:translation initiation factor IF-2 subunit gamma [Candidatus Woesearchaeota archaeon]|nr:translation initiation factor IF-2 subunit gamma [Candidatus Woesearchaeota archaeon]